ncbi:RNA recognition motif domain protein [Kalmanozyma brasiliensis GHG001]|uniref:RRM domain-containing protein n=1 Tax=Kalmanozyma brasiliensis (strain GHG001) TaxID=1365824 RepID=V5GR16_KALBG|nr:RNA recognition motif domain protein [Kalmanozyma brasiliensis GHG001]EST08387.1 RNA recognition motif domain protein [Kalmanozyma brasiliensis GHG001]
MAVASTSKSTAGNGSTSTAAPSPTLYVKTLYSKIKKSELRRQLFTLFSSYGRVLDIVATRAPSMRGQAFVVFESTSTSAAAKRALEGFSFYGQPLRIEYSTGGKSKALLRRELGSEAVLEADLERSRVTVSRRGEKRGLFLSEDGEQEELDEEEDDGARGKRVKLEEGVVLSAKGVPANIEPQVLETLFGRQTGFGRLTTQEDAGGESWSARIEFDSKENADAAKEALQDVQIDPVYRLDLELL